MPREPFEARELQALAAYNFEGRNEADVRADWIEPLLRLLGYGLGTAHDIVRERRLNLEPPVRMIGSTRLEIDYEPTVFGRGLWIIEAKRPQEQLFSDEHLGQAWSYATDPRVAVPLMVLCDGKRMGVFDVTIDTWATPVFACQQRDLPSKFDTLRGLLGAKHVAERVRRRQLDHLRRALEAQVDLGALDRTVEDVRGIVAEVRPTVTARRDDIRRQARESLEQRGDAAIDKAGIWGWAQHFNKPLLLVNWRAIETMVECVMRQAPMVRTREFDQIEASTTPRGESVTRMWFSLRAVRLVVAVALADADGCAEHCAEAAELAAHDHATSFADDPLAAATYRLQRALGPIGWRMAPLQMPALREQDRKLREFMDPEEWLRHDGEIGLTPDDSYRRMTWMLPQRMLVALTPRDVETVTRAAKAAEAALAVVPKTPGFERMQPIESPWLDSWIDGDPLCEYSILLLQSLVAKLPATPASERAADLLARHFGISV